MRRIHLFEFGDCPWFPSRIRNFMTDFLREAVIRQRLHAPIVRKLREAMERTGDTRIVDLCSGGGGVLPEIQREMFELDKFPASVTFTDKYPSVESLRQVCAQNPQYLEAADYSVDCTRVPGALKGFRSMFSAFHHFAPPVARQILDDAATHGVGIGIFEVSERALWSIVRICLAPVAVWILTPTIRPLGWSRLFWTYVVPVVPLVLLWDGLVSAFRTYSLRELRELTRGVGGGTYRWEMGQLKAPFGYKVMYLIGLPAS